MKNDVTPFARPRPTVNEMRGIRFLNEPIPPEGAQPPVPPAQPVPPVPPTPTPPKDDQLGEPGLAALRAERARATAAEQRVAALEAERQRLADAELSEVERLKKENQTLTENLTTTQREALRSAVALEKGLPANLASRLQGATRDEFAADADALIAAFPTVASRTPVPDPSAGPKNEPTTGSVQAGRDLFTNSRKKTTS